MTLSGGTGKRVSAVGVILHGWEDCLKAPQKKSAHVRVVTRGSLASLQLWNNLGDQRPWAMQHRVVGRNHLRGMWLQCSSPTDLTRTPGDGGSLVDTLSRQLKTAQQEHGGCDARVSTPLIISHQDIPVLSNQFWLLREMVCLNTCFL